MIISYAPKIIDIALTGNFGQAADKELYLQRIFMSVISINVKPDIPTQCSKAETSSKKHLGNHATKCNISSHYNDNR